MKAAGFGSIVRRKRGGVSIRYRDAQKKQRFESVGKAIGKRLQDVTDADAAKLLRKRASEILTETYQTPAERKILMAAVFAAKQRDIETRKIKALRHVTGILRYLTETFGHIEARNLTTVVVEQWIKRSREAGMAEATIDKNLSFLKSALRHAAEKITPPLLQRVPHLPSLEYDNVRQGYLTPAQSDALIAVAEEPVDDIIRFARCVGWRRTEILTLTWATVDREAGEIRIPDTKGGAPAIVPIEGELIDVMARRWKRRSLRVPFVFHRHDALFPQSTYNDLLRRAVVTAAAEVAIPEDARLHDFRRVAFRDLLESGTDTFTTMQITHHQTDSIAKRYAIQNTRNMRKALQRRDALIRRDDVAASS